MELTKTQLSAMTRLFSHGVLRELASKGRSPLFAKLYAESGLSHRHSGNEETVGSAYELAFSIIRQSGRRDEYVYRSALTHNIVLGRHSLNTATILNEFRAKTSKADFVILNGSGTVYEIKSDRDSLTRLASQISDYRKLFPRIYVITAKRHLNEALAQTPDHVGILTLERWNRIRTIREATECHEYLCSGTIFESLRVSEAQRILRNLNIDIPQSPNTLLRSRLSALFAGIEPTVAHEEMVKVLKRTRTSSSLSPLVTELPASLQPAAISIRVKEADYERLVSAVSTPLREATNWE